ncbi:MAG TPA: sulfurtransferase [Pedobacter sp.]|nr:sulfurtransferase [Pedobacter sp.]
MDKNSALVSAQWLFENKDNPRLVILDTSLANPIKGKSTNENKIIPNSIKFDWNTFSDSNIELPHMMLNEAEFMRATQELGINNNSILVVYDNVGVYSSPRVWWMFRAMGLTSCYVLNGGLPSWLTIDYHYSDAHSKPNRKGDFKANYRPQFFVSLAEVLTAVNDQHTFIIDARSAERFNGKVSEPRAGLRTGHIPNSVNVPFEKVLLGSEMQNNVVLAGIFEQIGNKKSHLIFSCGSGVTACIDALAATIIGYQNISIYDGSWSEWGMNSSCPVA